MNLSAEADAIDTATLMYEDYPMSTAKQLQAVESAPITPMEMLNRAVSTGAGLDTIEKLMNLQERWEKNEARKAFDESMAKAKAEIPVIIKNRVVDFTSPKGRTNYQHEDMAGIARVVDPILAKNGLSYRFRTSSPINEPVTVTCVLSHRLGHCEETTLMAGRDDTGNKNSHQAVGSAVTYLQRYTLKAALGLAVTNDDDAAMASTSVVTPDQAEELAKLIQDTKSDINKVLTAFQVESLSDLPASRFEECKTRLQRAARNR